MSRQLTHTVGNPPCYTGFTHLRWLQVPGKPHKKNVNKGKETKGVHCHLCTVGAGTLTRANQGPRYFEVSTLQRREHHLLTDKRERRGLRSRLPSRHIQARAPCQAGGDGSCRRQHQAAAPRGKTFSFSPRAHPASRDHNPSPLRLHGDERSNS